MLNIASEPIATPITNPRRVKKLRSTSGVLSRDSTTSSRTNAAAASANGPTTEAAPRAPAATHAGRRPPTPSTWPARQNRSSPSAGLACHVHARSPLLRSARPAIATNISRTLSQKIARHPVKCVSAPPSSGPMLKPSIRNPDQAPIAAARRSGAALVSTAASVLGTANAAARPCMARPASSSVCVPAMAMMQDAMPNSTSPAIDARRAPNRSAAWPPSTMKAAETTR